MSLDELPVDIRESTLAALRLRRPKLVRDLTGDLSTEPGLEHINRADLAGILITMLAATIRAGWVDARTASIQELSRFAPPLRSVIARQFFRTHDSAARHGGDSIAVLLPETAFDQAASLADEFREMVRSRAVLTEHMTDATAPVTLSAAAVGTDLVDSDLDHRTILSEAEAAVVRARMNGGDRTERVALLPTSVTIPGAASLLGLSNREVSRLLRGGELRATRRGRHLHIERAAIDAYRHRS